MIKNVLSDIGGVGLYGVISISLFFLVFTAALVRVCLLKKSFVNEVSALPLEDGTAPNPPNVTNVRTITQPKGESRHE